MAVWVGGMRASRYLTCFTIDVSSRDDSQVVLESVGRPRNTVLTAWQRYELHQALSCWLRRTRSCRARNSPRRSMEGDGDGGSWRSLVANELIEPSSQSTCKYVLVTSYPQLHSFGYQPCFYPIHGFDEFIVPSLQKHVGSFDNTHGR